jgi:hypothetical protein
MSEFARLNRGFVNWQGQRVFVPWFGMPRVVPSAAGETRILRLRFAMDFAPVTAVVLFVALAWWMDGLGRSVEMAVLVLGLGLFGLAVLLEQRWIGHWPQLSVAPFSRAKFMVSYYRSRPVGDRVLEFALGVGAVALLNRDFDRDFWARLDTWDNWLVALPDLVGFGLLAFLFSRHTMMTLISLLPRIHRRTVEKAS